MNPSRFRILLLVLGSAFTVCFVYFVIPPLLENFDVLGAFAGGFVNPFSTGYALDVIFTWLVLASWIFYEAKTKGIKYGWVALLLGIVPGVATGFAFYLLLRLKQKN